MSARWLKWAVIATVLTFGGIAINLWAEASKLPELWICISADLIVAMLFGVQAIVEGVNSWRLESADILHLRQRALSITPQNVLAEHMRQMHPSAIDILAMYGRMTWMVMPGAEPESQVTWVLYGTQVTYEFIGAFLQDSNNESCVPEWKFANEGAKHYAPSGMESGWCSDREQYRQLIAWLYGAGRVTTAHGNQPAKWIPPWRPELVARTMGVVFGEAEEGE